MAKWNPFKKRSHPPAAGEKPESHEPPAQGAVGRLLRQVREEKRLPLDTIEAQTRIRQKYLLALEEGRYEEMPTPGHIHGFLRNYALYLGLDIEEVEALYRQDRAARRRFEPKIFQPKDIDLLPKKPLFQADMVLGVVFVLLLTVLGWLFWRYGLPVVRPLLAPAPTSTPTLAAAAEPTATRPRRTATATATAGPETATAAPGTATPSPTPGATLTLDTPLTLATPTPRPTATSTPTITPTRPSGVLVQLKATDLVWLQVTVDGVQQPGEFMEAGQEKEWQGQYSVYMICGNAGGVDITVNGEQVGALGGRAQVVEKTWGPEGEMTPTPTAEAPAG